MWPSSSSTKPDPVAPASTPSNSAMICTVLGSTSWATRATVPGFSQWGLGVEVGVVDAGAAPMRASRRPGRRPTASSRCRRGRRRRSRPPVPVAATIGHTQPDGRTRSARRSARPEGGADLGRGRRRIRRPVWPGRSGQEAHTSNRRSVGTSDNGDGRGRRRRRAAPSGPRPTPGRRSAGWAQDRPTRAPASPRGLRRVRRSQTHHRRWPNRTPRPATAAAAARPRPAPSCFGCAPPPAAATLPTGVPTWPGTIVAGRWRRSPHPRSPPGSRRAKPADGGRWAARSPG